MSVPGFPFSAVPSGDGCWVFVSLSDGHGNGSVTVLRNTQGAFALDRTVAVRTSAFGEALSPDQRLLAVTVRDGVDLLDVSRLEQPAADPLITWLRDGGASPVYDAISRDNQLLFVSDERSHRISVFNLALVRNPQRGDVLIGHIPTGMAPVGLAVSPDGRWLYATNEVAMPGSGLPHSCAPPLARYGNHHPVGLLLKIDISKAATDPRNAVVGAIPAGCDPVRVAVSPSGDTLWVTAREDDALLRIPANDLSVGSQVKTDRYHIGTEPVGVAVRPDDKEVWVALSARFRSGKGGGLEGIAGIDGNGKIEGMSAPASGFPRNLSFLPDGRTLVVTLFQSKAVEFMPTP